MRKFTLLVILFISSLSKSFSQDIYTYVAASTAGAPSYVDPNIATASNLTAIGTGTSTPCAQGFSGITGFTGPVYSPAGACIQVSLTAAAGFTITAIGFTAHIRNSATGPVSARLAYSTDGGLSWINNGSDIPSFTGSCATSLAGTNLASWLPFSVTNTTILFRVFPFAAPGGGGTVQIYDLHILGNVHPLCTVLPTIAVGPSSANICTGGSGATLTASGAGPGGTYTWSPSIGLSAVTGASVVATPGSGSVTYTVTGTTSAGCANTASADVSVHSLPTASLTVAGPTSFCPGGSALLTATTGPGYTYTWFNGTSLISGAAGSSYIATASGDYTVQVTNAFGCSATSAPINISVASVPPAVITSSGSTTFCAGKNVVLNAPTGAGFTYQWYRGITAIPGANGSSYSDSVTGSISVRVTSAFGCSHNSLAIATTAIPLPWVAPSGPTSFCANGSVVLTIHTVGVTPGITYQWERGGSYLPGATSSYFTSNLSGSYQCIINIGFGGCVDTTTSTNVVVHPAPVPPISFNGTVLSTTNSYLTYQWSVNGVNINGAITYSIHPVAGLTNGIYKVKVTDSNGCTGSSNAFVITGTSPGGGGGTGGLSVGSVSTDDIKVYPNPASSSIFIESPVTVRAVITGIDGKIVIEQADAHEISIGNLANGLYIIMLYADNNERISVQKIIKQ